MTSAAQLPQPDLDTFGESELDELEDRTAHVLRMRSGMWDGELHPLSEVADELGITVERVRQIQQQGLALIRQLREVQRHLQPEPTIQKTWKWRRRR